MDIISIGLYAYGSFAFGFGYSLIDGAKSRFFSKKSKGDGGSDCVEFLNHVRKVESVIGFLLIVSSIICFTAFCVLDKPIRAIHTTSAL